MDNGWVHVEETRSDYTCNGGIRRVGQLIGVYHSSRAGEESIRLRQHPLRVGAEFEFKLMSFGRQKAGSQASSQESPPGARDATTELAPPCAHLPEFAR